MDCLPIRLPSATILFIRGTLRIIREILRPPP